MSDTKPPPKIRTAHYHDTDGLWTGEAVCRAGHALPLPDPGISDWQDEHSGCEPAPDAWAEIEAPLVAQGERDAELVRERLAEDERVAHLASSTRNGPGGHWETGCDCEGECRDYSACERVEGDNITIYAEGGHDADQAQHIARHDPARVLNQCASISDALTELERITDRSPDPDSRAWARAAICSLRRIWEADA